PLILRLCPSTISSPPRSHPMRGRNRLAPSAALTAHARHIGLAPESQPRGRLPRRPLGSATIRLDPPTPPGGPREDHPGPLLTPRPGTLLRPTPLVDLVLGRERGGAADAAAFEAEAAKAVEEVVARQIAAGIDVVSDGEMSKPSYTTYIRHRVAGIAPDPRA